mmetsp:Transcript_13331/g.28696  ORF Transcript_13331/g.28696 Transcript_13331/m.28696 type:complete len:205 (-) Transcript_13331:33-647(-)
MALHVGALAGERVVVVHAGRPRTVLGIGKIGGGGGQRGVVEHADGDGVGDVEVTGLRGEALYRRRRDPLCPRTLRVAHKRHGLRRGVAEPGALDGDEGVARDGANLGPDAGHLWRGVAEGDVVGEGALALDDDGHNGVGRASGGEDANEFGGALVVGLIARGGSDVGGGVGVGGAKVASGDGHGHTAEERTCGRGDGCDDGCVV